MNVQAQQFDPQDAAFVLPRENTPWGEPLLAGLPHLWIGVSIAAGKLVPPLPQGNTSPFYYTSIVLLVAFAAACLGVVFYAWRRGWPLWTASWYSYAAWMLVIPVGLAANTIGDDSWIVNMVFIFGILGGLLVGYLVLFRHYPLHALLISLFLMPVMTLFFMESIPDSIEALLSIIFGLLAGAAAVVIVRGWSWLAGVSVALITNLIAGMILTYISFHQSEIPNFYGESPADALLMFGLYFAAALILFLGPPVFWRIWDGLVNRRQVMSGSENG